ncbi:MAG: DNA polymerase III subunit alpha [Clostridiales Family XIII bacterium]|jgi:DNA polymerase-3 subunit alpha|nr:DNA polymerase III subunit alpha [Clostridiales Family XIII bacterium]
MAFIHLHVHSEFSLLDGLAGIGQLLDEAVSNGMSHLAITDHGNMFGVIDFYKAAEKRGVVPVIGCEVYVAPRSMEDREGAKDRDNGHLILLVETNEGYRNLVKIVSAGNMFGMYYGKPRVDKKVLRQYSKGLISLSGCIAGDVQQKLVADDYEGARAEALEYEGIFGKGNFFLEIQNQGLRDEEKILAPMRRLSEETGIPLVATNDIHYIKKEHAKAHDVLLCVQTAKLLSDENRMRFESDQFYFKTEAEMREALPGFEDAIERTAEIAARCKFKLDEGDLHLPEFIAPEGKSNQAYLRELCEEGFEFRYGADKEKHRRRFDYELDAIESMGFTEYFLVVWDFIKYARDSGIAVGPGRGSAAGSIVSYALRITDVDPIKYGLIFERFLNPGRVTMPDIDIDFEDERRSEVISYVIEKYGKDNVAQIITFGTMKAKAVIRDVGRVLDVRLAKVDLIAKMVPADLSMTLEKAIVQEPKLKQLIKEDPEVKELFGYARVLEGKSRHAGTHAAGVVITRKPVDEYVPLFNSKNGISTQYTMGTIENLGLMKMDFLGLRNLSVINDALEMVREDHGVDIDFSTVGMDDAETYALIAAGNTDGVFQLENGGMREFMKKMKPSCFEDITVGISLYRPGPMAKIPEYLANRSRAGKIKYDIPALAPILSETYGVIVYQEQVMQIAVALAGYDNSCADDLRKVMSKKKATELPKHRQYFVRGGDYEIKTREGKKKAQKNIVIPGCAGNGISEKASNKLFDDMESFAEYAFNKSHAAAYAVTSYRTAYLKTHYPLEFMAALMTSFMGGDGTKIAQYIKNCGEMGIDVLPPCVLASERNFTVEDGKIRIGLRSIKSVGDLSIEAIIAARNSGDGIHSIKDFVEKVDSNLANSKTVEHLIYAGAFDCLSANRAYAVRAYRLYSERKRKSFGRIHADQTDLFGTIEQSIELPELSNEGPDFTQEHRLGLEKDVLGIYLSGHPLNDYRWVIDEISNTTSVEINFPEEHIERRGKYYGSGSGNSKDVMDVIIVGLITDVKNVRRKKDGKEMAIILVEDLIGIVKVIVFAKTYERAGDYIREGKIVVVRGKEEHRPDEEACIYAGKVTPVEVAAEFLRSKNERDGNSNAAGDEAAARYTGIAGTETAAGDEAVFEIAAAAATEAAAAEGIVSAEAV